MFPWSRPPAPAGYADRAWRSAEGLQLHARDYPAAGGPARLPVLCIHGLTRNARDFEDLAPRLAATGRRVLAVDVRGRGGSDWDPNPLNYQPPTYVADVLALLAAAGIARAHFVGTSMGGLVTLALGAMKPEVVAGAVLNDIGPEIAAEGLARISQYVGKPAPVRDWREAARYVQRQNVQALPHYGKTDWARMARRLFREDASGKPVLDYDPQIAVPIAQAGGAAPPSLWPLWDMLTKGRPVLAIRGERSDLLSAEVFQRMATSAPAAAFAEVSDVGHAPMLDEPAALQALDAFFAEHP